jgi:protein phosphatase
LNPIFKTFSVKGNLSKTNSDYIQTKSLAEGWIGIVCDGVGEIIGEESAGKLCADIMIDLIEKSIEPDPLKKMKYAIEETNQYLYSLKGKKLNTVQNVTTLAVLFLFNHTACWGHVGDSRIYKLKNGRLSYLTKDHSVIQELVDGGFLTLKEATLHSGTNVIGRAMGEKSAVIADVSKLHLQPVDKNRFFLCTDGVTNFITDSEIENCLQNDSIEESSGALISLINKNDIVDDTSFMIVDAT